MLFDLDGTFADTAPDLANALNRTLEHWNQPELPFSTIRPVVSQGGIALIKLGFDMDQETPGFEERRQFLLQVYLDNICHSTTLFEGIPALLDTLDEHNIPWGIVTNKPSWLTDPLMQELGIDQRTPCIVSGDTCKHRKPHPEPLLHACSKLLIDPHHAIYVGDDKRDIIAGKAAGMTTIAATYGYIYDEDPADWHADSLIDHVNELYPLIGLPYHGC